MITINFAENLKLLRQSRKLTQLQLGQTLGVDKRTISAWETKVCEPSFTMLAKICEFFEEDFNSLLT